MCHVLKLTNFVGWKKLTNSLRKHVTGMWSGRALLKHRLKFVCQPRQANNSYAVMAAKRFQTRTEEELEQLLRDKIPKSSNEVLTLWFELTFFISDLFYMQITGICKLCNKVISWHPCIVLFWVGRYNKTLNVPRGEASKKPKLTISLGPIHGWASLI